MLLDLQKRLEFSLLGANLLLLVADLELWGLNSFLWKEANREEILPIFLPMSRHWGKIFKWNRSSGKKNLFPSSFSFFKCSLVMKILSISKVMCFITWWSNMSVQDASLLCSLLRYHSYKLLVSGFSALKLSVTPWVFLWDFRGKTLLSVDLWPPLGWQAVAPGEPQGAEGEQEPRFTWKHLIQDSSGYICLGKASGWSRCASALRS